MACRHFLSPALLPCFCLLILTGLLAGCATVPAVPPLAPTRSPTQPAPLPTPTAPAEEAEADSSTTAVDGELARIARLSGTEIHSLPADDFQRRVGRDPEQFPGHYFELRLPSAAPLATVRAGR